MENTLGISAVILFDKHLLIIA